MKNEKGFIGYFELKKESGFESKKTKNELSPLPLDFAFTQDNFLSNEEVVFLTDQIKSKIETPVGVTGFYHEYNEGDQIGSYRGTIFTENIANVFFERLKGLYPEERDFKNSLNSDHDEHSNWEFIGVNPLFRFIKYTSGGELVPHYDAPYIANDEERTLVTMIVYLTTNKTGKTRFIKDPQSNIPVSQRDLSDWDKQVTTSDDILFTIPSESGKLALFDHRIIHDCEPLLNEEKIIIRTDLMFRRKK